MTLSHSIAVALCVLGSLTGAAHGSNINGEATYISFSVPGALGTYPMSINASMTVTGYYYVAHVTPTYLRGFVRAADGAITTFDVGVPFGIEEGTVWTVPESINAAGDITGFYQYPRWVRRATRGVKLHRWKAFSGMPTATRSTSPRTSRSGGTLAGRTFCR
jgi:hypothetical protein